RPTLLLGGGRVRFATVVGAGVAHRAVPGLPWASAFALGAVVSPPDVAAATAFVRRLPLPRRLVTILEGESMINDAAAIVAYRMAVAAAVTGSFSLTAATGRFLLVGAGGIVVGLAVAWLLAAVRRHIHDPEVENTISLLTGYAAYLPPERAGSSGLLAAAIPTMTAAGTPFPGRDLVIAITFVVIVVTLLGQGFTLAPLMHWLGVRETGEEERREEIAARIEASEAALARLEELATESWMHPDALSHTRDRYRLRTRHLHGHADGVLDGPIEAKSIAQLRLARELLAVERRQLIRL